MDSGRNAGAGSVVPRVLGKITGARGPTLLVVAGLHGNEPAGVEAARRVVSRLQRPGVELAGTFTALAGNLSALKAGRRFIDRDLNRAWTREKIEATRTRAADAPAASEDQEQLALLDAINTELDAATGSISFIDLHTTSADGYPFSMITDRPEAQALALQFQLPIILGLLERVDGVLLRYLERRGCRCIGVEAGQNDAADSVDRHEAVLLVALVACGLLPASEIPELAAASDLLRDARGSLPRIMKVESRHAIVPEDRFRMEPGFANITPVTTGQLLATDRNGEIRARQSGLLIMPLYQGQGEEGFFLGGAVSAD